MILAAPESPAAPFWLEEPFGSDGLEVNGMGGGEGKRTSRKDDQGKIPIQCFLEKFCTC